MAKIKIKHLQSNIYTTANGATSNGTAIAANVVVDLGYSRGIADSSGNVILDVIGVVGGSSVGTGGTGATLASFIPASTVELVYSPSFNNIDIFIIGGTYSQNVQDHWQALTSITLILAGVPGATITNLNFSGTSGSQLVVQGNISPDDASWIYTNRAALGFTGPSQPPPNWEVESASGVIPTTIYGIGPTAGTSNVIQCIARLPTVTKNSITGTSTWDSNVSGTLITDGYIVRQRGSHKFIIGSEGNANITPALCELVNISNGNANALSNLTTTGSNFEIPVGYMAIQAVTAGGANVAVYKITDKHIYGFPPAYSDPTEANNNPAGNVYSTSTPVYYGSYSNANATLQPGPGSGSGTSTANGLFAVANVQNQA